MGALYVLLVFLDSSLTGSELGVFVAVSTPLSIPKCCHSPVWAAPPPYLDLVA